MSKKRILAAVILLLVAIISNGLILQHKDECDTDNTQLVLRMTADQEVNMKLYYSDTNEFAEEKSVVEVYSAPGKEKRLTFDLMGTPEHLRLDFGGNSDINIQILGVSVYFADIKVECGVEVLKQDGFQWVKNFAVNDGLMSFTTEENSPMCVFALDWSNMQREAESIIATRCWIKNILICVVVDIFLFIAFLYIKKIAIVPLELYQNRKLILKLAKNDIKTRFAGSYLGILWAFVNPIITLIVYWFVFQVGLRSNPIDDFPFILWFATGLIPWFFFSEALGGGTGTLIEYSYLVKKVVFKISVLPIVKVTSSVFTHVFFAILLLALYIFYGYGIDLYSVQIIYYSFCMFVLVIAISYVTSAVVVFFRDLSQIIGVVLQVGMWATPIMWSYTMIPVRFQWIFKLNPMFYVVEGYRNALIYKTCFWDDFYGTAYFWLLTIGLLGLGTTIFNRLKVHFADVL